MARCSASRRAFSIVVPVAVVLCCLACASGHPPRKARADAGPARSGNRHTTARDASAELDAAVGEDAGAAQDAGTDAGAAPEPIVGEDYAYFDAFPVPDDGVLSLAFDLPADAVSFVLTADPERTPRRIDLLALAAPDGSVLYDASSKTGPQPFDPGVASSVLDAAPYSFMLPSSPETPFATGQYRVWLGVAAAPAGADSSLAIDIVWKRVKSAPTSGSLSLTLWFVEGAMLDATAARSDRTLQAGLSLLHDIYAGAGIDVASIDYRDLGGATAAKLTVVHDDTELAELLGQVQTQAAPSSALQIVFVDRIESAPGKTVRGKTSGLPGPPARPSLPRIGSVLIALETLPPTSTLVGELLAHEAAHYLGLRHTSEYDGLHHDPIADTPECPADRARSTSSGTSILSAEDCNDLDGHNLMFYTPPQLGTAQHDLTPGQTFVLLRNPLVL
jgi:hypothetical protein